MHAFGGGGARVRVVRRQVDVRASTQRASGGQRLLDEDVQRGAAKTSALQRVGQGRLVDQGAAGGVDEAAAGLHQPQPPVVDQAVVLGPQVRVQGDEVALGQERVERDPFARGYGYDPFWGGYSPFGYHGRPYYSRFGYWGPRSPFYYGWDDPFWYGGYGGPYQEVRVYTEYRSFLDLE